MQKWKHVQRVKASYEKLKPEQIDQLKEQFEKGKRKYNKKMEKYNEKGMHEKWLEKAKKFKESKPASVYAEFLKNNFHSTAAEMSNAKSTEVTKVKINNSNK